MVKKENCAICKRERVGYKRGNLYVDGAGVDETMISNLHMVYLRYVGEIQLEIKLKNVCVFKSSGDKYWLEKYIYIYIHTHTYIYIFKESI